MLTSHARYALAAAALALMFTADASAAGPNRGRGRDGDNQPGALRSRGSSPPWGLVPSRSSPAARS